jgi:AbrB family looped-hinge helix DNA binding protein
VLVPEGTRPPEAAQSCRAAVVSVNAPAITPLLVPGAVRPTRPRPPSPQRALPLASLPALRPSDPVAYGMAAMDVHGRLSDRSVLDALGWAPGTAIGMDVEDGLGGPAAVAVTGGSGRITVAGQLRLPARIRHRLGLRAGDRVLLAGHPAVARLVCYPPATLDAVLAAVATSASGDPE